METNFASNQLYTSPSQFLFRLCGDLVHFDVPISTYFFNPIGNNGSHETANAIWIFYIRGKHAWKSASNQLQLDILETRNEKNNTDLQVICKFR